MHSSRSQALTKFTIDALIILGCQLLNTLAFRTLIVPARLLSGGVVGLAMLINQVTGLPIGAQSIIYNIPLFYLAYRYLGRRFVMLSLIAVWSFSILLDNVQMPFVTHDLLLVAVFGGILTGIADGLTIRMGGSTGGFDILGLLFARRSGMSIGQVFLIFNGVVIAISALYNSLELAMYTLIMQYVASWVLNSIQEAAPRRVILVISKKNEEIAQRIMHDLGRGVTFLDGSGAYTGTAFRVLMCVITRYELVELRTLIKAMDPEAFSVIIDASDVIGEFDLTSPLQRLLRR